MRQQLLPESDADCECYRAQVEIATIVMRQNERIDLLAQSVAAHSGDLEQMREKVSDMSDLLKALGDSCYSLASAVKRLTADS